MRKVFAICCAVVLSSGCATSKELAKRDQEIAEMRDQVQFLQNQIASGAKPDVASSAASDKTAGCPLAGKFYTPGSIIAGRICQGTVNGGSPWRWVVHL